jgi:hypothetical protein
MAFSMPGRANEIRPQDRHENGAAADRPGLGGEMAAARPPQLLHAAGRIISRSTQSHFRCASAVQVQF